MGVIREREVPIVVDDGETVVRQMEAGDMTVEMDRLEPNLDMDKLFKGLPDDMCQAEHWGYVIEGEMIYVTADGERIAAGPGEAYYVPPGHLPHTGSEGAHVVEFSKTADLAETMEVVERNMR
jgi:hypothetical protein